MRSCYIPCLMRYADITPRWFKGGALPVSAPFWVGYSPVTNPSDRQRHLPFGKVSLFPDIATDLALLKPIAFALFEFPQPCAISPATDLMEIAHVVPLTIGEKVAEGFAVRDALVHFSAFGISSGQQ